MRARWAVVMAGSVLLSLAGCSEDVDPPVKQHGQIGVPAAEVVTETSPEEGWKTIEYQGVRVDIPATWERSDMTKCEFQHEHWATPETTTCGRGGGVAFYRSDTFDTSERPGVHEADDNDYMSDDAPAWAGYVYAGDDWVVYVADTDRTVVETVLRSARPVDRKSWGVSKGIRLSLLTHCGVQSATFQGELWLATPPLGGHNPPRGWGENQTLGRFTQTSPQRAVFKADDGQQAVFRKAKPGTDDPNDGCK